MFKAIWLMKFRADFDPEKAREWWLQHHGAIALEAPGLRRYVQNHWIEPVRNGTMPYDGSVDCWFDDRAGYERAINSDAWNSLVEDGFDGFDLTTMTPADQGGIVREHIMRWDSRPDHRPYKAAGPEE